MPATFNTAFTNIFNVDSLLHYTQQSFYLAIAKQSAWDTTWGNGISDSNPPTPNPAITTVPEILLYKQPYYITLAVASQCGTIQFDSPGNSIGPTTVSLINLQTTSTSALYQINPQYLYIRTDITADDLIYASISSFRIAALFKNPSFNTTIGLTRYLPSQVNSPGLIYWTSYFTPILSSSITTNTSTFEILLTL